MPSNRARAATATHNNSTVQYARHKTSIGFKLAVTMEQVAWLCLYRVGIDP